MKKHLLSISLCLVFVVLSFHPTKAQDAKSNWDLGSDFVNRYVWRGTDFGNSPSVQPFISYSLKGFEVGTWGSFATNGADMQEVDLYASYSFLEDMISVGVTDYFFPSSLVMKNKYFEYSEDKTGHIIEGNLNLNGGENIPISLSLNYNFYGIDVDNSFYFELGYSATCKNVNIDVFAGATTGQGIYLTPDGDGFSFVNIGLTASKELKISDKWSLPVFGSLITNPQAENIFLVFGFSL